MQEKKDDGPHNHPTALAPELHLPDDILVSNVGALHLLAEIGEEVEVGSGRPLGLVGVASGLEDAHLLLVTALVSFGLLIEWFPGESKW